MTVTSVIYISSYILRHNTYAHVYFLFSHEIIFHLAARARETRGPVGALALKFFRVHNYARAVTKERAGPHGDGKRE